MEKFCAKFQGIISFQNDFMCVSYNNLAFKEKTVKRRDPVITLT